MQQITPLAVPPLAPRAAGHPAARHVDLAATVAARSAANAMRSLELVRVAHDPQVWAELVEMQLAFATQAGKIGRRWMTGLAAWTEQVAQIRSANTLAKLLEQDGNAINQLGALVNQNVTDCVMLVESAQVGFGYWVEQKVSARFAGQPEAARPAALLPPPEAPVAAPPVAPLAPAEPVAAAAPAAEPAPAAAEAPAAKDEPAPEVAEAPAAKDEPAPGVAEAPAAKDEPAATAPALAKAAREVAAKYKARTTRARTDAGPSGE